MKVTVAENWSHLQQLLFEGSWNDSINRHRAPYAYRGVTNATYPLNTSLMTNTGTWKNTCCVIFASMRTIWRRKPVTRRGTG